MTDPVDIIEQGLGYTTVPELEPEHRELVKTVDRLLAPPPPENILQKEVVLTRLHSELPTLMFRWSPHPSQSDYECAFCGQRPASWKHDIKHDDDCLGLALQRVLT